MAVAHYGYLILKIPSTNGVLKNRGDHEAGVSALEKLQALATQHEAAAGPNTFELTLAWLIISTQHAALRQRGRPYEDYSDRGGCFLDHPHHGGSGHQIGTHSCHLTLG
jgi:hypothetical protein